MTKTSVDFSGTEHGVSRRALYFRKGPVGK